MFDVSWSTPASETVGQHRQRKDHEHGRVDTPSSQGSSFGHTSSSGGSSKTKTALRSGGWSFFGNYKKQVADAKAAETSRPNTPNVLTLTTSITQTAVINETPTTKPRRQDEYNNKRRSVAETMISTSPSTTGESIFSTWQTRSNATESSYGGAFQLGPLRIHENLPRSPKSWRRSSDAFSDDGPLSRSISQMYISPKDDIPEEFDLDLHDFFPTPPRDSAQASTAPTTPVSQSRVRMRDFNELPSRSSSRARASRVKAPLSPQMETTYMMRHVRQMEAASSKIILERLREEWTGISDPSIYKELELDKKLWMLVGLKLLANKANAAEGGSKDTALNPVFTRQTKVLSLYESHASASYLSTLYPPIVETHHLSAIPASPGNTHSLRALYVSSPLPRLPYESSTFTTIQSLPLPALLPSPSLPTLLSECHRILAPSGTLALTLMDPTPLASTMGPCLRSWMEEHLLLKLETQFRCLKPCRLVPIWLQEAGFSFAMPHSPTPPLTPSVSESSIGLGKTHVIQEPRTTILKFPALAKGEGGYGATGKANEKRDMGLLVATIGRMLWREIWGGYVVGERWWWEDEAVVEECCRLGTRWEVMILEVVKE